VYDTHVAEKQNGVSGGVGLMGLVFIVFLSLKLAEVGSVAAWSWWWVLSPLWIPFVAAAAIYVIIVGIGTPVILIRGHFRRRSRLRNMMKDQ